MELVHCVSLYPVRINVCDCAVKDVRVEAGSAAKSTLERVAQSCSFSRSFSAARFASLISPTLPAAGFRRSARVHRTRGTAVFHRSEEGDSRLLTETACAEKLGSNGCKWRRNNRVKGWLHLRKDLIQT